MKLCTDSSGLQASLQRCSADGPDLPAAVLASCIHLRCCRALSWHCQTQPHLSHYLAQSPWQAHIPGFAVLACYCKTCHRSALQAKHFTNCTRCRCLRDGQFEQAVGVALETRRLDMLEKAIKTAPDTSDILKYALNVCQRLIIQRGFRREVHSSRFPAFITACAVRRYRCVLTAADCVIVRMLLSDVSEPAAGTSP